MFTVKFLKTNGDGSTSQTSVCCLNYSAQIRPDGDISITTYRDLTDNDGVERHVGGYTSAFDVCYVENMQGKTIDRFPSSHARLS